MNGLLVRLRLFLKLWFTSLYAILIMLLIPITAFFIYSQSSYTVEGLASLVYEEVAPIWFVLILQGCLSIDIDSKFHMQMMTYPITRWKFLMEKVLFAAVIFIGLLSVVALAFTPFFEGLDTKEKLFFKRITQRLSYHSVIIISTHLLEDIERIADASVLYIAKGRISFYGGTDELDRIVEDLTE